MNVSVTLVFSSAAEAASALSRLSVIRHEDRPDVGVSAEEKALLQRLGDTVTVDPQVPLALTQAPPEFNPFAAAAAAPAVPPEVAAAPAAPTVDKNGLPWDSRIHASTKTLNADGTWRQRRGLNDPGLVSRIEAELRAAVSAGSNPAGPVASAAPAIAAPAVTPIAPPTAAVTPPTSVPTVPAAPPAPASIAPPAAPSTDFASFMARMAPIFAADQAGAMARMVAVLAPLGLTSPAQLAARPDLIMQVEMGFHASAPAAA